MRLQPSFLILIFSVAGCATTAPNTGGGGGVQELVPRPVSVCPAGMNEDSSADARKECGGKVGADIKNLSGHVEARCFQSGATAVKCALPPNCANGFEVKEDGRGGPGRLHCFAAPAPVDPCAGHRIRSQAAYDECLTDCERTRRDAYDRCGDPGCRGGVNNAYPGCIAGCAGAMQASRQALCCLGCQ